MGRVTIRPYKTIAVWLGLAILAGIPIGVCIGFELGHVAGNLLGQDYGYTKARGEIEAEMRLACGNWFTASNRPAILACRMPAFMKSQ